MVAHGGRGSHEVIVPRVAIWANHGYPLLSRLLHPMTNEIRNHSPVLRSQPSESIAKKEGYPPMPASKHLTVAIYAADLQSLRDIVRTYPLDYGCRPHVISDPAGR